MTKRGKRLKRGPLAGNLDAVREWVRDGELDRADAHLRERSDPDARRLRALIALRRANPADALAVLEGLEDPASEMVRAEALLELGRHADARASLESALRQAPDNPSAYERLAAVSRGEGDLTRALEDSEGAIALDPTRVSALGLKASLLDALGRTADAIEVYRSAVRGRGGSGAVRASILHSFSVLLEKEGAHDEAREARALAEAIERA